MGHQLCSRPSGAPQWYVKGTHVSVHNSDISIATAGFVDSTGGWTLRSNTNTAWRERSLRPSYREDSNGRPVCQPASLPPASPHSRPRHHSAAEVGCVNERSGPPWGAKGGITLLTPGKCREAHKGCMRLGTEGARVAARRVWNRRAHERVH